MMIAGGTMRATTLTVCFALLCSLAAPALAAPGEPDRTAEHSTTPARKAASKAELDRYAQREQASDKQQKFEGGRGQYIEVTTLLIIVLVVLLIVIIV
jgi:hypothetical protein